jgi:outer membrane protein OmpA-like peptidoglycan-associated protein/outer membrane protein assembly factor BamB
LWTNEAISAWGAALVILEDSLLVQHRTYRSPGSFLACLDADTGKTRWMQAIPHEANIFPPLVLGDRVLQAAHDTLAVFALKDGHPLAKIRFSAPLASHPTVMQDSLFLPLTDGRIVSLDSSSLVQRTAFGHHRSQGNALAASAGRLYLASDAGEILELSASNGQVMRSLALPSITTHVQPFLCGGLLFATGKQKLVCIGPTLDREPDETVIESPSRRTLVLLDAKTGEAIQGAVRLTWEGGHAGIRHLGVETDPQGVAIVPHVIPDASRLTIERAGYTFSTFEWPATTSRLIVRLNPIEKATPIILEDVHFDIDSAGLLPASLPILHSLARFLQTNPGLRIRIEGHTDSSGEAAANMALSLKRSLVIREYLIRQGIGAWRMQTEGLGASRPIAPNSTEDGRSKNRRTEIRILS